MCYNGPHRLPTRYGLFKVSVIPGGACRSMNISGIHSQAAGADRRGGGALRPGAPGDGCRLRSAPAPGGAGGAGGRIGCWLRVAGYTPFSSHVVLEAALPERRGGRATLSRGPQETIGYTALRSYPVVSGAWSECTAFRNVWNTKDTKPREEHEGVSRLSRSFVVFVIQTLRAPDRLVGPCARWRCSTPTRDSVGFCTLTIG